MMNLDINWIRKVQ
jgi:hypothetical protein